MYNNINIKYNDKLFTYAFKYDKLDTINNYNYVYCNVGDNIYIYNDEFPPYIKQNNSYMKYNGESIPIEKGNDEFSNIKILFPLYSIDTYKDNIKYAIEIYTNFNGKKIYLYSDVINRCDALACNKVLKIYGNTYMEYIGLNLYFPEQFINIESVFLSVNISIVEEIDNKYYDLSGCNSGYNFIDLNKNKDKLNFSISCDALTYTESGISNINCNIQYNSLFASLKEYINEYYGFKNPSMKIELVIKDNISKNIIKIIDKKFDDLIDTYKFDILEFQLSKEQFLEGLSIMGSLYILSDDIEMIYIISNEIPLTQELLSYFLISGPRSINLNNIDMNIYNINTVNKTINNVVKMNTPEESKNNIIQPVFFKALDLANIVIHPAISENICINLDQYKSKVKYFMIKIEGITFNEIGRTTSGVIFNIKGNYLPQTILSGNYFILDQDANVITNGKYNYDY